MNIIRSLINYFDERKKDFSSNKLELILQDWEQQLKDPKLNAEDRAILLNNIARSERFTKEEQKKLGLLILGFQVGQYAVGCTFGPVAAGITKIVLSRTERSLSAQKGKKIIKAIVIGGRRQKRRRGKEKPFSNIPDIRSASDGALTAASGAVSTELTNHVWTYLGEILRGLRLWR